MFKRLKEILTANTATLDTHDRNMQMWVTFLFISSWSIFILPLLYFSLSPIELVVFFLGFETFPLIGCLIGWYWDTLNKHFDMTYKSIYWSSEGLAVSLIIAGVAALVSGTIIVGALCGLSLGGFIIGFTFSFGFFYPTIIIFLKRKTVYTLSNMYIEETGEKVYGYQPGGYYAVGITSGVFMFMYCFNRCFLYISTGNWLISLIDLIVAFTYITLILSPNIMNKILPFELKRWKNFWIYLILCVIISFIIMSFM